MRINFLVLGLITFTIQGIAQKIAWNPTFKVNGFQGQVYLGEQNKKALFLHFDKGKDMLLEFSADKSAVTETALDATVDARYRYPFIKGGQLYFISCTDETKKRQCTSKFTVATFSLDGHKTAEKVIFESTDEEASLMRVNSYMSYNKDYDERSVDKILVSENKKYIGIHFVLDGFYAQRKNKFIIFETTDFKEIKTIDLGAQESPKCILLNNGDLLTVQGDSRSVHGKDPYMDIKLPVVVTKFELNSTEGKHLDLKLSAGEEQFRYVLYYNPSSDEQMFYLTMTFGKNEPDRNTTNLSQQAASGVQLFKVNLEKMEQIDSKIILFTEALVLQTGKKNKGVYNLRISDVKEDAGSYYIAGQEIINFKDGTMDIQHNGDLVILRESKSNGGAQTCIPIKNQNTATGFNTMLYNNNYYLVYHTAAVSKMLFHLVKLNQGLETVHAIEDESFTNHQLYLDVSQLHRMEKNKYCIYGLLFKNGGSAIITLDE